MGPPPRPGGLRVGAGDAAADGSVSRPPLARAWLTADTVSCWVGVPAMLWPMSETAARLPPVAAPTPTSQAPIPSRTRVGTGIIVTGSGLRRG